MPYTIAAAAQSGFAQASNYDAYRPSYPDEAVSSLLKHLEVAGETGAKILDLAAGTGKLTELLARRTEQFEILAVEPHAGMREECAKKELQGVETKDGDSTHIPVADGWADAVTIAQAFHWFANNESLNEIHRVLRPGGTLGLIWNAEDYNSPESWTPTTTWEGRLKETTWSFADTNPRFRHLKWRTVFEERLNPLTAPLKASSTKMYSLPLGEESVKWTVWLTPEAVWNRYCTLSQVAVLEGEDRERVKKAVLETMEGGDVEKNEKGEVALHGVTFFAWTTKI